MQLGHVIRTLNCINLCDVTLIFPQTQKSGIGLQTCYDMPNSKKQSKNQKRERRLRARKLLRKNNNLEDYSSPTSENVSGSIEKVY